MGDNEWVYHKSPRFGRGLEVMDWNLLFELDWIDDVIANFFPLIAEVLFAVEGNNGKVAVVGEEGHMIVDTITDDFKWANCVTLDFERSGTEDITIIGHVFLHGFEVFFDLAVLEGSIASTEGDIDCVVIVGVNRS